MQQKKKTGNFKHILYSVNKKVTSKINFSIFLNIEYLCFYKICSKIHFRNMWNRSKNVNNKYVWFFMWKCFFFSLQNRRIKSLPNANWQFGESVRPHNRRLLVRGLSNRSGFQWDGPTSESNGVSVATSRQLLAVVYSRGARTAIGQIAADTQYGFVVAYKGRRVVQSKQ